MLVNYGARDNKVNMVLPRHVLLAVRNDEQLFSYFFHFWQVHKILCCVNLMMSYFENEGMELTIRYKGSCGEGEIPYYIKDLVDF